MVAAAVSVALAHGVREIALVPGSLVGKGAMMRASWMKREVRRTQSIFTVAVYLPGFAKSGFS
jgi:hypothetical protein